ncbi:MAG: MauE/DoxX family redox-associated membrane protein [Edaphobacter sp.]
MKTFNKRLNASWWALRIALGVMPILSGIDKYFNKLADWGMYLSPYATKVIPVSTPTFMHIVGIVEIVVGVIVLSRWTKIGSYILMAWLICIAINLVTTGMSYDIAVRDIEIAVGAFALSQLTEVREEIGRSEVN